MIHTLDAQGKKIGRVASEAAKILMGKNLVTYARNMVSGEQVKIVNAGKADIDAKKKDDKVYVTFTGFRGGLNSEKLGDLITRKGAREAIERAVYRMLPSNSLRKKIMKNLTITE